MDQPWRNERQRLKTVRLRLARQHPFWGFLLLHAKLVPAPGLPTFAATDCMRVVWFNPRLTRHLNKAQLSFVLCHEVGHMLLASAPRRRHRDPHLWNCATDYAINRIVDRIGLSSHALRRVERPNGTFPEIGEVEILLDSAYDGMIAETIYERLLQDAKEGAGISLRITLPAPDGSDDGREVEIHGHPDGSIDVHVPGELSEEERQELTERIHAAVRARQAADQGGNLPGSALRQLGIIKPSVVPWQRVLHRFAGECLGRLEYAMTRPRRLMMTEGVIAPGLVREGPGRVVVAVDASASMDTDALEQAAAELSALAGLVPELTVLIGDARVQEVVPTHELPRFLKQRRFRGGGGTDHRPIFSWIAAQPEPPELFIGISDLWSQFPKKQPRYPVLWLAPPDHGAAPWGQVAAIC